MLSSMIGPLSFAVLLALGLMVAAVVAEGRARHVARVILELRSRRQLSEILEEEPREPGDWELVAAVNSIPDRPAPGERVAAWAAVTGARAARAVSARAEALTRPAETGDAPARSSELGLAQR